MTDSLKLRAIILASGKTYKHLAECLGITPYCLSMKIENETEFKVSEVIKLSEELGITSLKQRESIFFKK